MKLHDIVNKQTHNKIKNKSTHTQNLDLNTNNCQFLFYMHEEVLITSRHHAISQNIHGICFIRWRRGSDNEILNILSYLVDVLDICGKFTRLLVSLIVETKKKCKFLCLKQDANEHPCSICLEDVTQTAKSSMFVTKCDVGNHIFHKF